MFKIGICILDVNHTAEYENIHSAEYKKLSDQVFDFVSYRMSGVQSMMFH